MSLEEEENAGLARAVSCLENQMDGLLLGLVQERVPRVGTSRELPGPPRT